uniref:Putative serine/threonine-protein phosphatase 4 regulatory subunit 2 n=1 Tax=Corethrella appendiculata TaxID=1370023 RepID=U5EPQ0_9DIPT
MDNPEEILQSLERFTKLKQKDIPRELDEYLAFVARTGDTVYRWSIIKQLFREKLMNVITDFHDSTPSVTDLPIYPNVDPFNYEVMKRTLLERLDAFNSAPFTVQRICELLTEPRKQYSRIDKFMRAVEKNILVVSTQEPGRRRSDSENENGDSLDSIVNGDLEVNVDIDMDNESFDAGTGGTSGNHIESSATSTETTTITSTTATSTSTAAISHSNDHNENDIEEDATSKTDDLITHEHDELGVNDELDPSQIDDTVKLEPETKLIIENKELIQHTQDDEDEEDEEKLLNEQDSEQEPKDVENKLEPDAAENIEIPQPQLTNESDILDSITDDDSSTRTKTDEIDSSNISDKNESQEKPLEPEIDVITESKVRDECDEPQAKMLKLDTESKNNEEEEEGEQLNVVVAATETEEQPNDLKVEQEPTIADEEDKAPQLATNLEATNNSDSCSSLSDNLSDSNSSGPLTDETTSNTVIENIKKTDLILESSTEVEQQPQPEQNVDEQQQIQLPEYETIAPNTNQSQFSENEKLQVQEEIVSESSQLETAQDLASAAAQEQTNSAEEQKIAEENLNLINEIPREERSEAPDVQIPNDIIEMDTNVVAASASNVAGENIMATDDEPTPMAADLLPKSDDNIMDVDESSVEPMDQ